MRRLTKVPESNFWNKSIDCNEGDIYCSFADIYCSERNEHHQCLDSVDDMMIREFLVDETSKEVAKVKYCGQSGKGVEFPINTKRIEQALGKFDIDTLKTKLKQSPMLD